MGKSARKEREDRGLYRVRSESRQEPKSVRAAASIVAFCPIDRIPGNSGIQCDDAADMCQ